MTCEHQMVITFATIVRLRPTIYQNTQNWEGIPGQISKGIWSTSFAKKTPLTASNPHSKMKHQFFYRCLDTNSLACNSSKQSSSPVLLVVVPFRTVVRGVVVVAPTEVVVVNDLQIFNVKYVSNLGTQLMFFIFGLMWPSILMNL